LRPHTSAPPARCNPYFISISLSYAALLGRRAGRFGDQFGEVAHAHLLFEAHGSAEAASGATPMSSNCFQV
ncbi:MAG: hypothetical protein ACRETD_06140, partial [Steroidobacteraceae bacterium]